MTSHHPITGRGDPQLDAPTRTPYFDTRARRLWYMTGNGWKRARSIQFDTVRPDQKEAWIEAAKRAGLTLEQWVFETLDREANL